MFLHQFLVSILPYVLEHRLSLEPSLIQDVSTALLAESALVSILVTPLVHRFTDHLAARTWLLLGLLGQMGGSMSIASAHSCNVSQPRSLLNCCDRAQPCISLTLMS
jgi:Ca2+/H+ antiporter